MEWKGENEVGYVEGRQVLIAGRRAKKWEEAKAIWVSWYVPKEEGAKELSQA